MKTVTTKTQRPGTRIVQELPRRHHLDITAVAWLTGLPERVVRENIALCRTRD